MSTGHTESRPSELVDLRSTSSRPSLVARQWYPQDFAANVFVADFVAEFGGTAVVSPQFCGLLVAKFADKVSAFQGFVVINGIATDTFFLCSGRIRATFSWLRLLCCGGIPAVRGWGSFVRLAVVENVGCSCVC